MLMSEHLCHWENFGEFRVFKLTETKVVYRATVRDALQQRKKIHKGFLSLPFLSSKQNE